MATKTLERLIEEQVKRWEILRPEKERKDKAKGQFSPYRTLTEHSHYVVHLTHQKHDECTYSAELFQVLNHSMCYLYKIFLKDLPT